MMPGTAVGIPAAAVLAALLVRAALSLSQARRLAKQHRPADATLPNRSLTIAQPVLSGDPLLESRLAANLAALPGQQHLWLTDRDDEEAARVTARLRQAHPAHSIRIEVCAPCPDATNPKLWKLRTAASLASTPFFCVLDDDTVLPASSAAALTAAATTCDLATALPFYERAEDPPSRLLGQFVNNNSIFTYLATTRLIPPFTVNGMAWVMRTERLAWLDNFTPLLHHLTDDLALAELVLQRGGSLCQTAAPVFIRSTVRSGGHYWRFMHRWYVFAVLLMRRQPPARQLLIFTLHGLPPLLLIWLFAAFYARPSLPALLLILAVALLRMAILALMQKRFSGHVRTDGLSLLSEVLQPLHLIHALACRTIRWRTRRYRVRDINDFTSV